MIIQKLKDQIQQLNTQIDQLQAECSHPEMARHKEIFGDSGYYDGSSWSYTDNHCLLCDKQWRT